MTTRNPNAAERRRRNRKGAVRRRLWFRVYQARLREGLEPCRVCLTRDGVTFEHIDPMAAGGDWTLDNLTFLCVSHQIEKGDGPAPWPLTSLAAEEAAAPPERQWYKLAREERRCGGCGRFGPQHVVFDGYAGGYEWSC